MATTNPNVHTVVPIREIVEYLHQLLNADENNFRIGVEVGEEEEEPGLAILLIANGRKICFHIAITNTDIENAKAVCSQTVIYRSTEEDALLYFAVYDWCTRKLHICRCDPCEFDYEDISHYSMATQEEHAKASVQSYVASNAQVLR